MAVSLVIIFPFYRLCGCEALAFLAV